MCACCKALWVVRYKLEKTCAYTCSWYAYKGHKNASPLLTPIKGWRKKSFLALSRRFQYSNSCSRGKHTTYKKASFMTTYIAYNIFAQFIDLAHEDNTEERIRFSLPKGYSFRSLNKKLRSCYKHKYGKKLPKDKKKAYTFKDYVDFFPVLRCALEVYPQQVSQAIETYNQSSVDMQVEIIFSIVDMVDRFESSFVAS